jgi:hypothetical protein
MYKYPNIIFNAKGAAMYRFWMLLFVLLMVSGCANNRSWYSDDYSQNEIRNIMRNCRAQAITISGSNQPSSNIIFALIRDSNEKDHYEECLITHGLISEELHLADNYFWGRNVQQDYGKALKYYLIASEQGYPDASYNVGALYANGDIIEQDFGKTLEYYLKATDQGFRFDKPESKNYEQNIAEQSMDELLCWGAWAYELEHATITMKYYGNYTFLWKILEPVDDKSSKLISLIAGNWNTISNNIVTGIITTSNLASMPVGKKMSDEIIQIDDQRLILKYGGKKLTAFKY